MGKKVGSCLLSVLITFPGTGLASTLPPSSTSGTAQDQISPIVSQQTVGDPTGSGLITGGVTASQLSSLEYADVTGPQLVSGTLSPGSANVGDTVTITAKATDDSGVGSMDALLYNGDSVRDVPLSYDSVNDAWSGTYIVQSDDPDGTWNLGFDMFDTAGNYSYADSDQTVQIVNPGGSAQSPEVTSFEITPQQVTAEQQITINAKIANSANIDQVVAFLTSPSGGTNQNIPLTYDSTTDEWTANYTFGKYDEAGNWSVVIDITDKTGLTNYGTSGTLQVTNPNEDITDPVIGDVSVDQQTVKAGDTVKITTNLSDSGSGIDYANAYLDGPEGSWGFGGPLTLNAETGLWEAYITIPSNVKPGTFTININTSDAAGNYSSKTADQTVEVQNDGDFTAPTVSDFSMSSSAAKPGDVITFTATVADDKSTVRNVSLQLVSPAYQNKTIPLSYNSNLNKWVGSYVVGKYDASGSWNAYVSTQDSANNYGNYTEGKLTIDNPNGDSQAPTIDSVDLSPSTVKVGDPLTIKVKASDAQSGVSAVNAYVGGKTVSLSYDQNSDLWVGSYTVDKRDAPGKVTVGINAVDNAGNTGFHYPYDTVTFDNPDYDNTPPVLDSLDLSPSTVNGGEDLVITATAHDDKSGIGTMYASITPPEQDYGISVPLNYDSTSGKWVGKYTIQPNDRSGEWTLTDVSLQDKAGNYGWSSEEKTFTVNNPDADYTAPVIDSVSLSSQNANVGDRIKITIKAHDDKSGIQNMSGTLISSDGELNYVPLIFDKINDEWTGTYFVGANTKPGDWTLRVNIGDEAGNHENIMTDKTITVTNPDADVNPPEISNIQVSSTALAVGDKVQITADISDDKSGIREAYAGIENAGPSYGSKTVTLHYDPTMKKWVGTFEVLDSTVPGSKDVAVTAVDYADNYTSEYASQLFTVNNPSGDYTGPVVHGVTVSSSDVNAGDQVTFTADVTDTQSGVAGVTAGPLNYLGGELNFKQDSTGKWIATIVIPNNVPDGERITLYYISAMDKKGNFSDSSSSMASFVVHNSTGDYTAPKLEDLQVSQTGSKPGDTVQIKAKVTDDQSGVKSVTGSIVGGDGYDYDGYIEDLNFTYDEASGYWVGDYKISQYVNDDLPIHLVVEDNNGNSDYLDTGKYVTVSNPNPDYAEPVINSLEVTPSTANVGDEVTIKASVKDNESGVRDVGADLNLGNHWERVQLTYDAVQKQFIGTYKVKTNDPSGKWLVDLYAIDYYGHTANYEGIFQVNNPDGDVNAPYLDSLTVSSASAGVGDTVNFVAKLADVQSGMKSANIMLRTSYYSSTITIPLTYDAAKDEWTASYTIPSYSPEGLQLISLHAEDVAGNQLDEMTERYLYIQNDTPDNEGPVFGETTVTPGQATVGDTVDIKVAVSDEGSGVDSVTASPYNQIQSGYDDSKMVSLVFDKDQNAWTGKYTIQANDNIGNLTFGLSARDKAGNISYQTNNPKIVITKPVVNSENFGTADWYYGQNQYFNAVYYAGLALDEGDTRADLQTLMNNAAKALLDSISGMNGTDAANAYQLLSDTTGVPSDIKAEADAKLAGLKASKFGDAQWYNEQKNYYNAVSLAAESIANGDTRPEVQTLLNDAAKALLDSAASMSSTDAENAYQLLSTTAGVPSEIKDAASAKLATVKSPKFGEAQWYNEHSNYYNAVSLAAAAIAEGDTRPEVQTLLNDAAQALLDSAASMSSTDAENAYQLLSSTTGVPSEIKDAANAKLAIVKSPKFGEAQWYNEQGNYYNAVSLAATAIAEGDTRTDVQALLNDAAKALLDSTASMGNTDAENAYQLLSTTAGVPSDIKGSADAKLKGIAEFGDAQWYKEQQNYFNAVYYAAKAMADGDNRAEVQTFLNDASQALFDSAASLSGTESQDAYQLLANTQGVPADIQAAAQAELAK